MMGGCAKSCGELWRGREEPINKIDALSVLLWCCCCCCCCERLEAV
jgi:hypothetical protein